MIAVHGQSSNKEDAVIVAAAMEAVERGYQVISFDLPLHGDRLGTDYSFTPEHCISDLLAVYAYGKNMAEETSVFACSIGAYFSLLAYQDKEIRTSLFLSPVVDMEKIIVQMMTDFKVSEKRLASEKIVELPIGQVLDWDYYCFVKQHPIDFEWSFPIHILYGQQDTTCQWSDIESFRDRYKATVKVDESGGHYYHTEAHLTTVAQWMKAIL